MKYFYSFLVALMLPALMFAYEKRVPVKSVGEVLVLSENEGKWSIDVSHSETPEGKDCIKVRLHASAPSELPEMSLNFRVPLVDMYHVWFSGQKNNRFPIRPDWDAKYDSQIARDMPLLSCFNDRNRNRLTLALSDSFRPVRTTLGVEDMVGVVENGSVLVFNMSLFEEKEAPCTDCEFSLLIDNRDVFWSESLIEANQWMMKTASLNECPVPESAFDPLYSSWYQFHRSVNAADIEAECRKAAEMGIKTVIVDDGWQLEDNNQNYTYCGDWQIAKSKFPDMKAHVDRVHKMGMKYMLWYSVPFMGPNSNNYKKWEGKYLYSLDTHQGTAILDPRFPEVRHFLSGLYEQAMRENGYDGLKLDFIDRFLIVGKDPAIEQNYAGRDIKSLTEAVNALMIEVREKILAIKPDALIEFRQRYVGPAIRQYGNMFRVSDCPNDFHSNRINTANLRLTSGNAAVHSDMLEWSFNETPQNAAKQILSSLFSVVQYSVMLRNLPDDHQKMLRHWITFTQEHRQTLLHGKFIPWYPQSGYPVLEGRTGEEQIVALYQQDMSVSVGGAPRACLVNATDSEQVTLFLDRKPSKVTVYDTFGEPQKVDATALKPSAGGRPSLIRIPVSGYACFEF